MKTIPDWGPIAVIVGGYLPGIYFQNRRIDDLSAALNKRFDDINRRFDDMNKRFDDMRDLIKSEIKRLEDRIIRLESRVVKH